jgi:ECF transporter S component (folate family)
MSGNRKKRLYALTAGAMMAALSIILERVIAIMPASNMMDIRISLSNVPIILAGIVVSPLVGALSGVVSDIVGCFISGYAPFPILTLAPLITGFLPGIIAGKKKTYSFIKIFVAITVTHIISSVIVTTYGLSVMRGVAFIPMLVTRLPSCGVNLAIDVTLVYLLLKTPLTKKI